MRNLTLSILILITASFQIVVAAEESPKYLLEAKLEAGDATTVSVELVIGGDLISRDGNAKEMKQPRSVTGKFEYQELIIAKSAEVVRSLRKYSVASATIKVNGHDIEKSLPAEQQLVAVDLRNGLCTINGCQSPLTREQLDLVDAEGNSLAIDQLLPGRKVAEGENWDHDSTTIGALLGMDHVAVCKVSSVIVGHSKGQVQVRLGGTVHGTIDGTTTEIELRGAYLFHQKLGRITKFNLAIKENRAIGGVTPGLDMISKVKVVISPAQAKSPFSDSLIEQTSDIAQSLRHTLLYHANNKGFRFQHDANWFVTSEQRDLLSLRFLQGTDYTSHCNVTTLPARSAGRGTSIEKFESDIRDSLKDNLVAISTASQWTTSQGHHCLGVIANGKVKGVDVQWRYFLISADGLPRVTFAITVEQSQLERFNDADRKLIESLELFSPAVTKTAGKSSKKAAK